MCWLFLKNKTKQKKSPKLYTSYRNTSISNVEMTSLWKVGLCTEVTCIALLCLEEASSWCDSSALRRDRLLLCSWGRRAISKEVTLSILLHRQGDFQGKTTCRHCIQLPNNAPQISWLARSMKQCPNQVTCSLSSLSPAGTGSKAMLRRWHTCWLRFLWDKVALRVRRSLPSHLAIQKAASQTWLHVERAWGALKHAGAWVPPPETLV